MRGRGSYIDRMDRRAPALIQLFALLALLVATSAGGPVAARAAAHPALRALSGAVGDLPAADTAVPVRAKQALVRAARPDDKDTPGSGHPPLPAAATRIPAPEGGAAYPPSAAAAPPASCCAIYRARAPPAE